MTIPFATLFLLTWCEECLERAERERESRERQKEERDSQRTELLRPELQRFADLYPELRHYLKRLESPPEPARPSYWDLPSRYSPYEYQRYGYSGDYFRDYGWPMPTCPDFGGWLRPLEKLRWNMGLPFYFHLCIPGFTDNQYRWARFCGPIWLVTVCIATYEFIGPDAFVASLDNIRANWPPLAMTAYEASPFWTKSLADWWQKLPTR